MGLPAERFSLSGRRLLKPGFLEIIGGTASTTDTIVPPLTAGEVLPISKCTLREGKTKPPDHLSESELLSLMEKHGIGTDASMASHIENISKRGYVTLGAGRRLIPTELGETLIRGYLAIDPELVRPRVRAAIEAQCDLIAKGEAEADAVTKHTLALFEAKFRYFQAHVRKLDELFEAKFSPLTKTGKSFSKCGTCLRYMKLIEARPQRLYCPTCMATHSLPQGCTIKLMQGHECPLDGFQLLRCSTGNKAGSMVSWPLLERLQCSRI